MSTLSEFVDRNPGLAPTDIDWLHSLLGDWQIIADMALADLVLWLPTSGGTFEAVAHARPSGSSTVFYRDLVGQKIHPEWEQLTRQSFVDGTIRDAPAPDWYEQAATRFWAIPVRRAWQSGDRLQVGTPIAVVTRHGNLSDARTPTRLELALLSCASDLLEMVSVGDFPDLSAPSVPRRGAPRVSDGIIRVDEAGVVVFASPNAVSAYKRLGCAVELEGRELTTVTADLVNPRSVADEGLPLVTSGRASWRVDVEGNGMTVTLRSIPIRREHMRIGGLVMCRDVTEFRRQEQQLLTKDATIREIHHRVKNNLQTVSSLLRIQARRCVTDEARTALLNAMRRVESIAVVHDTLSQGLSQTVDFDDVFDRVLKLVAEVATDESARVHPEMHGSFGTLPSEYATPLSLVLTELVTNAIEHGLAGRSGKVWVDANRHDDLLDITVGDNGQGLQEGKVGTGLGTQIVRTLIEGELSGTIDWHTRPDSGTEVAVSIPLPRMAAESSY